MGKTGRRATRHDAAEEARVVVILAFVAALGPFVVLGFRPLLAGYPPPPLAVWEKVLLVGVTPLFAVMSLALFFRSSGARARKEAKGAAALAGVTLVLAVASAVTIWARGA